MIQLKVGSIKLDKYNIFLSVLIVGFFALFAFLTISQHRGLKTHLNDLGNMVQPLHNTFQGRFMQTSSYISEGNILNSRFASHSNYIFLLLLPIYYLFPSPETLLILQQAFYVLAAVPLFYLAFYLTKDKRIAIIPAVLYLFNINVQDAALFDFHPIVLLPFLLFSAFYFYENKKYVPFYLMLSLMLLLKEDMSLVTAMIGIYLVWAKKDKKRGAAITLVSALYFLVNIAVIMPAFADGSNVIIEQRYSHLGKSPIEVVVNFFRDPQLFIDAQKMMYLLILFLPFLFLPIFSWRILILALPHVAINILSSNSMTYHPFYFYHSLPIVSVLMLSSVYSIAKIFKQKNIRIIYAILIFAVVYSIIISPAPYSLMHSMDDYAYDEHSLEVSKIKSFISPQASLSVQNNLGAHFADREEIYVFPVNKKEVDYVLVDLQDPFTSPKVYPRPYNFIYYSQMTMPVLEREIAEMFDDNNYEPVFYTEEGYLLFSRSNDNGVQGAYEMYKSKIELLKQKYQEYDKYL